LLEILDLWGPTPDIIAYRHAKPDVRMLRCKAHTHLGGPSIHDGNAALLHWPGSRERRFHFKVMRMVIELFAGPQALQQLHPLGQIDISFIMPQQVDAEHVELSSVPPADHIQREAPPGNMI